MAEPTTATGRSLLEAVRAAVLPPEHARLIGPDGKQQLVALVSVEVLEHDILAIEREAEAVRPEPLDVERLVDAELNVRDRLAVKYGESAAWMDSTREHVKALLAEYARLSPSNLGGTPG